MAGGIVRELYGNGARLRNAVAQGLAPEIVLLAGFSNEDTGLDCVIRSRFAIGTESTVP